MNLYNLYNLLKGEITQKELLNFYNATITYEELPKKINGYVFQYKGIYNIMINKYLSYYKKKKTILHELAHIELNHLDKSNYELSALNVAQFEDNADEYISFIYNCFENETKVYVESLQKFAKDLNEDLI